MPEPIAGLDGRFQASAPWREEEVLPPAQIHLGRGALALSMSAARVRAWREGWARAEGSPLRPRVLDGDETTIVVAASAALVDPTEHLIRLPRTTRTHRGTRRFLLAGLDREVNLPKALGRTGLARRHVDRYLNATVEVEVATIGVGFGGLGARWWRDGGDGEPVALRCDRAHADAWLALELAGLGDPAEAAVVGEAEGLATLAVALREGTHAGDVRRARAAIEPIVRGPAPVDRVQVWIEGPELVRGRWEADGARVGAPRARWLLQHVDGLSIAAEPVRVRCEPALRPGRKPQRREPRAERQRRIFSRWDDGVRVDDEGLVGLTPEKIALELASRVSGVVIDGTCGVGGLTIALARTPAVERVIAVDRDSGRLRMARHNARVYEVTERIEFVCADTLEVLSERAADWLVLDPPWGGRDYDRDRVALDDLGMDVRAALEGFDGDVMLKLPRSFDPSTLPGSWHLELVLDEREIPKLLLAIRAPAT